MKDWRSRLATAVLAALVFWALATLSGSKPVECVGDNPADYQSCSQFAVFLRPIWPLLDIFDHHEGFIVGIGTAFIALFTYTLVKATSGLRESIDKLWDAGEKQAVLTKSAADAATKSANAAVASVDHAKGRAAIELRAYLSVEPAGVNAYRGVGASVVGHIHIRNAGKVPAKVVRVSAWMDWSGDKDRPIEHMIIVDDDGRDLDDPVGVIQPNSFVAYGAPDQSIVKTDGFIFVFGRATYFDGFSSDQRFVEFCHRYPCARFETKDRERQIETKYARNHTSGNNAN